MDNTKKYKLFCLLEGINIIVIVICLSLSPTSTKGRFKTTMKQLQTVQQSVAVKSKHIYTACNPYLNLLFPVSKELVLLFDAYFDSRARNGHGNLTGIFIAASKGVLEMKLITGCGVGIFTAKHFN